MPRVILIDIETSPNLVYTWGKYQQDALRPERTWQLLSVAWKELGARRVECASRPDFDDQTDESLTRAAWDVVDGADVLVGHNIDGFDMKKLRAKFAEHRLAPPTPARTVDTLKVARSQFAFYGNKLADLGMVLGVGSKARTGGIDLWFDCMEGEPAAWKRMVRYNKRDVTLLEDVYMRLRAWAPVHPNLALFAGRPGCPACASPRVQRQGERVMRTRVAARWKCSACGHWFSAGVA